MGFGMGVKGKKKGLQREKKYRHNVAGWDGGAGNAVTESGWSAISSQRTKATSSPHIQ